jgi:hypothetical protein
MRTLIKRLDSNNKFGMIINQWYEVDINLSYGCRHWYIKYGGMGNGNDWSVSHIMHIGNCYNKSDNHYSINGINDDRYSHALCDIKNVSNVRLVNNREITYIKKIILSQ